MASNSKILNQVFWQLNQDNNILSMFFTFISIFLLFLPVIHGSVQIIPIYQVLLWVDFEYPIFNGQIRITLGCAVE